LVELFGRNCGETALVAGFLADADRSVIAEVPFDIERLANQLVADKKRNPSNYAIMVMSEGAHMIDGQAMEYGEEDAYGHKKLGGIGQITGDAIKKITGIDIVNQTVGYLMRSGAPDAIDRMAGFSYGNMAVDQLLKGHSGLMVAIQNGVYTTVPADTPLQGVKRVDTEQFYDSENYKAKVKDFLGKPLFWY
jgi:6-phosphofructokinase 1